MSVEVLISYQYYFSVIQFGILLVALGRQIVVGIGTQAQDLDELGESRTLEGSLQVLDSACIMLVLLIVDFFDGVNWDADNREDAVELVGQLRDLGFGDRIGQRSGS